MTVLKKAGRITAVSAIGAFIMSFIQLLGAGAYDLSPVNLFDMTNESISLCLKYFTTKFLIFFWIFAFIIIIASFLLSMKRPKAADFDRNIIKLYAPLLFIVYLPAYISYYPGILSYDTAAQVPQALGQMPITNYHPVLHTLLLKACISLGNLTGSSHMGLVIYSVFQMIVFTYGLTYALLILYDLSNSRVLTLVSGILYLAFPTFVLFSFIPTKDVLFAVFFNLTALKILKMISSYETSYKETVETSVYVLLSLFFRNNALHVLLLMLIVSLIIKRFRKKQVIIAFFAPIILFVTFTRVAYPLFDITQSPSQEKLSVPIMQIAAVNHYFQDSIDEETHEKMLEYLPAISNYTPLFADYIKNSFNNELFDQNPGDFFKLWLTLGSKHPAMYLKSFLYLNIHYWYLDAAYPDIYECPVYIETNIYDLEYFPIERAGYLKGINSFFEKYASFNLSIMRTPVIRFVFLISFPFIYMFAFILICIYRKAYNSLFYVLFFVLLLMTYLLGPCCNTRYILPMLCMIPLSFSALRIEKEEESLDHEQEDQ